MHIREYIATYIHTYTHTYMYIREYIHTYMHAGHSTINTKQVENRLNPISNYRVRNPLLCNKSVLLVGSARVGTAGGPVGARVCN